VTVSRMQATSISYRTVSMTTRKH